MIDAGSLTDRIVIEQATETRNAVGEVSLSWSTFATVWADVSALSGREAERYGQIVGFTGHKVTIRALAGVKPAMRILYAGSRTLEIGAINEYERIRYMELICTEKAAT
jgi:SPP1 family predicted phage head-tail adaptor